MYHKKSPLAAAVALFAGITASGSYAQSANENSEEFDPSLLDEIVVVTSYRKAQQAALDKKRNSANNVSSIIAEDIGKMPDLNLAESLQRSPGVAITREGGEGRQITVRGLGPNYTRVTLNGMEVPSSTGGLDSSGGVNRGRAFDFNIFSSDLFREITINKNAVAHVEEGGLASTVELFTLRPLDKPGMNIAGSLQGAYNYHTGESDPRINALFSNTFADDMFGVIVGLNHTERTINQEGFGTVRWTGPASNLRGNDPAGWGWADTSSTVINGTPNPEANYPGNDGSLAPLDYMWAPRLPRMDSFNHDQERTGYLIGLQAQPTDQLELSLNYLSSERKADVTSYNYFAQFRNLHNSITPNEVTLDPSGRFITAGSFSNVATRSESRGQFSETKFEQLVANVSYDFSDTLRLDVMYGEASNKHEEQQFRYNLTSDQGYDFAYSFAANSNVAEMSYGFDINDPANYTFTGPVHRDSTVERENTTFKVDLTWEFDDNGSNLMAGLIMNDRNIDSDFSDVVTRNDLVVADASNTNSLASLVDNYGDGISAPGGFPRDWLVADFGVVRGLYDVTFQDDSGDTRNFDVSEETQGAYVELNYRIGDQWWLNGGLRFVETTVSGNGLEQSYDNTLPAINLTYEPVEDVLLRASYSENIARPNPASLSGAVDPTPLNGTVLIRNPGLEPEIADAIDLAVEWYFAEESFVGITYFQKEISDAITGGVTERLLTPAERAIVSQDAAYSETPLPTGIVFPDEQWEVTESVNSPEVDEIQGYEIGFNYVFPIGIGVLANYTYIDSDDIVEGLSETSYNLGTFYENDTYAARIVVNSRDDYITDSTGSNGNAQHGTTGPTRVDFSGSYNVNDNITLTLEVINLTNEKERLFTTGPEDDLNLIREYNTTGTEIFFGVRANF